jgi:hypothetical protein
LALPLLCGGVGAAPWVGLVTVGVGTGGGVRVGTDVGVTAVWLPPELLTGAGLCPVLGLTVGRLGFAALVCPGAVALVDAATARSSRAWRAASWCWRPVRSWLLSPALCV